MKKKFLIGLFILVTIFTLTGCVSVKERKTPYDVENPVQKEAGVDYKMVSSMKKTYRVRYTFFSSKQKPSDDELVERIQALTVKNFGPDAVAGDISFTKIVKDTIDLISTFTLSSTDFSSTKYKIEAMWNVYVPKEN